MVAVAAVLLFSGSLAAADDDSGTVGAARGVTNGYLGDDYIGCLEMGFARCFAHPTLICLEDAMVECSLQAAGINQAAAAAPAAELVLGRATRGGIMRGITKLGAKYIECVEAGLVKCLLDPTIGCVEEAPLGAC